MRLYATVSNYYQWTGDSPPVSGGMSVTLLRRASAIIDTLLLGVPYDTDADGMPTNAARLAVMRDATCAQALFTTETGDSTGSATAIVGGASIGTLHLGGSSTGTFNAAQQQARRIAPDALNILRVEGMLNRAVNDPHGTPYDFVPTIP